MATSIDLAPLSGCRTPAAAYCRAHLEPCAWIEAEIVVVLEGRDEESPAQSTGSPRASRWVSTRSRAGWVGATDWASGDCAPARSSTIASCTRHTQQCNRPTCDGAVELVMLLRDKELRSEERATVITNQRSEVTMRVPQPCWQPLLTQRHHQVEGVDVPAAQSTEQRNARRASRAGTKRGFHVNRERS